MDIDTYEIRWSGGRVRPDLCSTDAGPVLQLIEAVGGPAGARERKATDDRFVADPDDLPQD